MAIRVASFYSGVGGLLVGLTRAGWLATFAHEPNENKLRILRTNVRVQEAATNISLVEAEDVPHPEVVCARPPLGRLPDDMTRLLAAIRPRVLMLAYPHGRSRAWRENLLAMLDSVEDASYRPFHEVLDAQDFGVPQSRPWTFVVAFRSDITPLFLSFPFPDPTGHRTLGDIMEAGCPLASTGTMNYVRRVDARNKRLDVRFGRHRIRKPGDICPRLSQRYMAYYECLVDDGRGPRWLSKLEFKRAMGFPDEFVVSTSRTRAYALLGDEPCPPVAAALASEVETYCTPPMGRGPFRFGPGSPSP